MAVNEATVPKTAPHSPHEEARSEMAVRHSRQSPMVGVAGGSGIFAVLENAVRDSPAAKASDKAENAGIIMPTFSAGVVSRLREFDALFLQ